MVNKKGTQKIVRILIFIFYFNVIFSFLVPTVTSANNEFVGVFEYTFYVDSYALKGTAEYHRSETSSSISTYFGSYQNVLMVRRTNCKLSHSYKGFIEISDDKAYLDENYYLRKSEAKWKIRLKGYYEETFTVSYEYGDYVTLQNTPTVFEQTYSLRYYRNGIHRDTIACRDYSIYETQETITVEAGTYKCDRFKTYFYEDGPLTGYSIAWYNYKDGTLIKIQKFDESNNIYMLTTLISESRPIYAWQIASWVLGALGIIVLVHAVYTTRKKRIVENTPKIDGKIEPIRHKSRSSHEPRKSSTPKYEPYESWSYEYRPKPKVEFKSMPDPIFAYRSKRPNPNCPLCFGKGVIYTKAGHFPCPFCDIL